MKAHGPIRVWRENQHRETSGRSSERGGRIRNLPPRPLSEVHPSAVLGLSRPTVHYDFRHQVRCKAVVPT